MRFPRASRPAAALALALAPVLAAPSVAAAATTPAPLRTTNVVAHTVVRSATAQSVTATNTLTRLKAIDVMAGAGVPGWSADTGASSGDRSTLDAVSTAGVANAAPAAVYLTSRWDKSFDYHLYDLTPGRTYAVRIHLVEDNFTSAGKRVMDVQSNGATVVSGLDPYAVAGARRAVVRQFNVTPDANGVVDLKFIGRKDMATLSGLELFAYGANTAPATPSALVVKAPAARTVSVSWRGSAEATSYTVYRNGVQIAKTTDPDFLDLTVAAGRTYSYRVTATGPTGRVSAASTTLSVTTPANDLPKATGKFHVASGVVVDPAGHIFTPVGANLGSWSTASGRGAANGEAVAAKAWGWNTVRLTFYTSDEFSWTYRAQWGYPALLKEVDDLVKEYRAQGIVVILDGHDTPEDSADPARTIAEMTQFWKDMGTRYQGDSGVWFNLINEPHPVNRDWYSLNERFLSAARSTGAQNIAIVDAPVWGQDLGSVGPWFLGAEHGYDASMAPRLAARYGNVMLSQHNYGGYDMFTTAAAYGAYADKVQRTGLALITGETGFTIDGSTTAGGYDLNHRAALATFASNPAKHVGTLVWNGTHSDNYSLKNDGGPFYSGSWVGANLSEMGRDLWALTH